MRRSRLNKNTEKKTQKTIILSVLGIIVVLFLLLKFGVEILVNFSLFVTGSKNQNASENITNQINFIAPPILNSLPSATNSAHVVISGKATAQRTVNLYINSKKVDQVETEKDGSFTFRQSLKKGSNQIKAKVEYKDKESDFSNVLSIIYSDTDPNLEISSPTDGQSFSKDQNNLNVTGKTDSGVTITVNGFWALIDESNSFSYTLPLQNGENLIKIIAIDQAGNKTEKEIKVNYSQ